MTYPLPDRGRLHWLLLSLVFLIVVYPFFEDRPALLALFLAAVLVAAIGAVSTNRRDLYVAVLVARLVGAYAARTDEQPDP